MSNRSSSRLRVEWQVVTHAPVSFGIALLTVSLLIGGGLYWHFHTKLILQTDKIVSQREENDRLRHEITRLVKTNALNDAPLNETPDPKKDRPDPCRAPIHNSVDTTVRPSFGQMRPSLFNRSAANLTIYDQLATVNAMGRGVVLGRIPILGEKGVGSLCLRTLL
jgi:hypothetical protein